MGNTYSNLLYHIIFSTKGRQRFIHPDLREELYRYLGGVIRGEGGVAIEIGGVEDHVHLLAKLKPATSVSDILNRVKSHSTRWVHEHKPDLREFAWQTGYAAFSVSESQVDAVRRYIRNQPEHHRRQSLQEELEECLKKHNVDFDPKYLSD